MPQIRLERMVKRYGAVEVLHGIDLKMADVYRVEHTTHPVEYDMYYSV